MGSCQQKGHCLWQGPHRAWPVSLSLSRFAQSPPAPGTANFRVWPPTPRFTEPCSHTPFLRSCSRAGSRGSTSSPGPCAAPLPWAHPVTSFQLHENLLNPSHLFRRTPKTLACLCPWLFFPSYKSRCSAFIPLRGAPSLSSCDMRAALSSLLLRWPSVLRGIAPPDPLLLPGH